MPAHKAAAALLALALVVPVGGAVAQQPSPGAILVAKELITVKGAAAIYEPIIIGVIEQTRTVLLRTNPMLSKDLTEVATKLRAEYTPRSTELLDDAAKLYASRFTEQELKEALAFYKSPLGRKMVAQEPLILDQSMKNAQAWANRLSEEVIGRFRVEMKRRGHEI
jgi:uncharacterized protein